MHTRALFSVTLLAVAASGFAAEDGTWDYWVRVQASVGSIGLSGDASYEDNNVPGTSFDMADVGLDASETTPAFELGLTTPLLSFHAFLGYQSWSTDGSATLTAPISFGGQTFAGTINSSATISDLYGEFCWAPIELNPAGFTIGLAVHQLGLQSELSSVGQSAEFDENILVPTLAVRAYVAPLDMLEVEAMVHGLAVPIGDVSGSFLAAQIQASYYPMDYIGFFAGYRHTMIDLEVDDGDMKAEANVALSGPFLGIAAQF
jgi:hypothetical protein